MSIFLTRGEDTDKTDRKDSTIEKLIRMNKALSHEEPDRVPVSDFYWGGFIERWKKELNLPDDANPYYHYDMDWIVTVPNMDPWIREFETIEENTEKVVVKTGFGAYMSKKFDCPMPENYAWEIDTFGFHLMRGTTAELRDAVEVAFVPAEGRGQGGGAAYSYLDLSAVAGPTYTYWLVDVDTDGQRTVHGPLEVPFVFASPLMAPFQFAALPR